MAERQPPPASPSTLAAGHKRKSGSGADGDADQAKKPKPAGWVRDGLRMIDDAPVWHTRVHVDTEPASSGDEGPLGVDYGSGRAMAASPEELGGGSTRQQWGGASMKQGDVAGRGVSPPRERQRRKDTASYKDSGAEEGLWLPRKGARHTSGEPRDIWSPEKLVRHDTEIQDTLPSRRRPRDDFEELEATLQEIEADESRTFARTWDFPEYDPNNRIRWGDPIAHMVKPNAASPNEQGGGSTRYQWGDAAGRRLSPQRQRQRLQFTPSLKEGTKISEEDMLKAKEPEKSKDSEDTWPPRTRRRPRHGFEELEDELDTFVPQYPSPVPVVKGAKAVFRDEEDTYNNFVFGSRSKREGKVWHCLCKARNSPKRKFVFRLPKFRCNCGRKFVQDNDLDFCLADVRVNFELVVSRIFEQKGPNCIANALCQAMLIMHTMDCIAKSREVNDAMADINPRRLIKAYIDEYRSMDLGLQSPVEPSSVHKFIKMALMLKNKGIELKDGTFSRIGDVSFIAKDNYEAICEELANGVPLLAIITPGINFEYLKYCQVYRPPLLTDFHDCNNFHKQHNHRTIHEAHMVVLVGPAFKAKGKNPGRAYYFANSHKGWCERKVLDDTHESGPGIKKPVDYGIGKIEEKGLVYSVIKLWKFDETAGPGSITLEDEDEDEASKDKNKISNKQKFTGEYMARPSP